MHKRRVLVFRESAVHTILLRQLATKGCRVFPKVRLDDAIAKDGYLEPREFQYFRSAHFDFLVLDQHYMPVFAVEFDGAGHQEPYAIERDVIKNRICNRANLPLLRVTGAEISEADQLTVLDYMLMRYIAWQEEGCESAQEIEEFAACLPSDADPDDYAVDLDPTVHFDLRHPFPGTTLVRERLWKHHGIAWALGGHRQNHTARLLCDVGCPKTLVNTRDEQFTTCELTATLWEPAGTAKAPILTERVSVSIRAWLPLQVAVPDAPVFFASGVLDLDAQSVKLLGDRVNAMWFPHLPGVSPWDIAENYAEYLGFRAIERWAHTAGLSPL
jgi:hypothetical protein